MALTCGMETKVKVKRLHELPDEFPAVAAASGAPRGGRRRPPHEELFSPPHGSNHGV